ncbi:MAG: excinuclease ABC subunit UvrA [Asgard group archaeon]|nr:excinuclease ABC subunit UvrA [Asgard group archaeon]
MYKNSIEVIGAQENNLRNISVEIPHDKLIVISGISGSGKSSLAFDTIYLEAQRRYMETLSAYARQFIGNFDRPQVEHIDGLRPTISIDQKTISRNPRSTVGTLTEIYDYMRVLFARVGIPHCPDCKIRIEAQPSDQVIEQIFASFEGQRIKIVAPIFEKRKGEYRKELAQWKEDGYVRLIVDGKEVNLDDEEVQLERYVAHDLEIIVDRNRCERKNEPLILDSVNLALELSKGRIKIIGEKEERVYSTKLVCPECGLAVNEFNPRDFSHNTAVGACKRCKGLGQIAEISPQKFIVNHDLSIADGAIATMTKNKKHITYASIGLKNINVIVQEHGYDINTPIKDLTEDQLDKLLYGTGRQEYHLTWNWDSQAAKWSGKGEWTTRWRGLIPATMEAYYRLTSEHRKQILEELMEQTKCPDCKGMRLKPESLAVLFNGKNISELNRLEIDECLKFFEGVKLTKEEEIIGKPLLKEIKNRLSFLLKVGLHYLTMNRAASELSGGEAQRTRLATQIGSKLQGVNYVLDEPSIGLANRDNQKLLSSLKTLRDGGNTVIVVEHDEDTLRSADLLLDLGPGAGDDGGEVLFLMDPKELSEKNSKNSITAKYLLGLDEIEIPKKRRTSKKFLTLKGASHNNLKQIDVSIPLGTFTCVTGVSGSGKSSLVADTLYPILVNKLHNGKQKPGRYKSIEGSENIDKVVVIDQSPIGRTSRSNPATYTKVMDHIRDLFATIPTAKIRGYSKTRFSFNTKLGRCEACKGHGYNKIEMTLLPDVEVECEICKSKRYDDETLKIKYQGHSIADILNMTVSRAMGVFENIPKIQRILKTLIDVGLDYIQLGQSSTTISGGEAQRIKLSRELSKISTGNTLYILDESTTGLSFEDIKKLLNVLQRLVDKGNTVLIIEHNLDVIKVADFVIDLGPDGGEENGGYLVDLGTPEEILENELSYTGQALKKVLTDDYIEEEVEPIKIEKEDLDPSKYLYVRGATKNNLKSINLDIPKEKLVVITGPSGSGKSSLAIDTLFAEGQRRFVESLSSYARQFLTKAERADVDDIIGLTPSIAIDQHSISKNPRSIVATTTEIYDYLRLLYAKVGIPHCPVCNIVLKNRTSDEIAKLVLKEYESENIIIASSLSNGEEVNIKETIKEIQKQGYNRIVIDGKDYLVDEQIKVKKSSSLSVVIDRIEVNKENISRTAESIEAAVSVGKGRVEIYYNGERSIYSINAECIDHEYEAPSEIHPRLFSFNHYSGACSNCTGLGTIRKFDIRKIVKNWDKSISQGAIGPYSSQRMSNPNSWRRAMLDSVAKHFDFTMDTPMKDLTPQQLDGLFYGSKGKDVSIRIIREREKSSSEYTRSGPWEGLIQRWVTWMTTETESRYISQRKEQMHQYYSEYKCTDCNGRKLKTEVLAITVGDKSINDLSTYAVDDFLDFLNTLKLNKRRAKIADRIIVELKKRAEYLTDVGLSYLTLDRRSSTLSNGEAQRIRLASQIGSGLIGVTYVLDEPTIGLHPRDIDKLLTTLKRLRDNGNHVIVVEHDDIIIKESDHMIELGPLGGDQGGDVVAEGNTTKLLQREDSLTASYLSGSKKIKTPKNRRKAESSIELKGASQNNLKQIDVEFGKGIFTAVTGVSGAGKSSLVIDTLQKGLEKNIQGKRTEVGKYKSLTNFEGINKVIVVDQSSLSKSRRSNPSTYLGVQDNIRDFFALLPESKARGFTPGHFSFNTYKGQCNECRGLGHKRIELLFLSDVWVLCPSCKGKKYKKPILTARYRKKSIADILEMTIEEACELFSNIENIRRPLQLAVDVGLGYLRMGQPTTTISGGEAERLKIARELSKKTHDKSIYLLDEPSQGLHFYDIEKLVNILHRLADEGNSIVVIDHNMDIIKNADRIIDLGPEGGTRNGGYLVAKGTPEEIINQQEGYTWEYLKQAS